MEASKTKMNPNRERSVSELDLLTSSYDFELPDDYIAREPASPRDSARLMVYDRLKDQITHSTFDNLLSFIPNSCDIFLNDTRVIKARVYGNKKSGGKIELLLNKALEDDIFQVMIKGKVHVGSVIVFAEDLRAEVLSLERDGSRKVRFYQNERELDFHSLIEILEKIGHIPLPPYMRRESTEKDENEYQTVFSRCAGAVAAPTASLHFTENLLARMKERFRVHTLTLHVGAGTFKPVESSSILRHSMHSEYFDIPEKSALALKKAHRVMAVGTTVTRTIEYFHRTGKTKGECDIFLHPANTPKKVDILLTNFHLPRSTLIMLVSSFVGREKVLELYREAVDKRYRFYSYGDAMLII